MAGWMVELKCCCSFYLIVMLAANHPIQEETAAVRPFHILQPLPRLWTWIYADECGSSCEMKLLYMFHVSEVAKCGAASLASLCSKSTVSTSSSWTDEKSWDEDVFEARALNSKINKFRWCMVPMEEDDDDDGRGGGMKNQPLFIPHRQQSIHPPRLLLSFMSPTHSKIIPFQLLLLLLMLPLQQSMARV